MYNIILSLSVGLIAGIILLVIPIKNKKLRNLLIVLALGLTNFFTYKIATLVYKGKDIAIKGSLGDIAWSISPDPLGALFACIASTLWVFAIVYSFGYMEDKERQEGFYGFLLISMTMTLGIAYSGNLIALYLFYELLTFTTYPLVIHDRTPKAIRAGNKYILYSLIGAGLILIATVLTAGISPNLNFAEIPILAGANKGSFSIILLLFIAGFGVKAAIMPLHGWLPSVMVAPTPVSAIFHAVAVVYSGVYGILRVFFSVFGFALIKTLSISKLLPYIASITIVIGIIQASRKNVLKERLAYQTISHLSYILLGLFVLNSTSLKGALMHMISYSALKISMFFCAGIISEKTGKTKINQMEGIGHEMPVTMSLFAIAIVGMIGMLPLSTFWGKLYIMKGASFFAFVLIFSGIMNAVSFVPFLVKAFTKKGTYEKVQTEKRFYLMIIPTIILISFSLLIGLIPGIIWPIVEQITGFFLKG